MLCFDYFSLKLTQKNYRTMVRSCIYYIYLKTHVDEPVYRDDLYGGETPSKASQSELQAELQ
jgi:hypothetical protein